MFDTDGYNFRGNLQRATNDLSIIIIKYHDDQYTGQFRGLKAINRQCGNSKR